MLIGCVMRKEKFEDQTKWFVNESYVKAFETLGCAIFPISSNHSLYAAVNSCDALLIPGGYDILGYYQQEEWNKNCSYYMNEMDYFDFRCIEAFVNVQKPILGICRGLQLLNVYFQGTLKQHIHTANHCTQHQHKLFLSKHSLLKQVYPDTILVNSYHHQVVEKPGNDLLIQAVSEDGEIEALVHQTLPIFAVQWHPEIMSNDQIIPFFLHFLAHSFSSFTPFIN